ncbi:hypothetical protein COO59_12935 [Mixta theicola]|uniref:Uncharacterized protein n=1 Tax=Mixta theicola TaxID=1458355 RepID=A0A2K1Q807_9GAMM|nr:hypothetical protein COO59_12935 [Mixta theicola]
MFFILLAIGIGRLIGDPYKYINCDFSASVANFIYDGASREDLDDVYYDINYIVIFSLAALIYFLIIRMAQYARKNGFSKVDNI